MASTIYICCPYPLILLRIAGHFICTCLLLWWEHWIGKDDQLDKLAMLIHLHENSFDHACTWLVAGFHHSGGGAHHIRNEGGDG